MVTNKLFAKKRIRKLRMEKKRLETELSILKAAGVDNFPIASELLSTKILHIEGEIIGIRWMINTSDKAAKKEVKKEKKAEAAPAAKAPVEKKEEPKAKAPAKKEEKKKVVKASNKAKMEVKK